MQGTHRWQLTASLTGPTALSSSPLMSRLQGSRRKKNHSALVQPFQPPNDALGSPAEAPKSPSGVAQSPRLAANNGHPAEISPRWTPPDGPHARSTAPSPPRCTQPKTATALPRPAASSSELNCWPIAAFYIVCPSLARCVQWRELLATSSGAPRGVAFQTSAEARRLRVPRPNLIRTLTVQHLPSVPPAR